MRITFQHSRTLFRRKMRAALFVSIDMNFRCVDLVVVSQVIKHDYMSIPKNKSHTEMFVRRLVLSIHFMCDCASVCVSVFNSFLFVVKIDLVHRRKTTRTHKSQVTTHTSRPFRQMSSVRKTHAHTHKYKCTYATCMCCVVCKAHSRRRLDRMFFS